MRLAVISDVHGNAPALDAVLEHLAGQHVDAIVCLGDHVSGPIDPAGAAKRLMGLSAVAISGNHDRWTVDLKLRGAGAVDRFARGRLSLPWGVSSLGSVSWVTARRARANLRRVGIVAFRGEPGLGRRRRCRAGDGNRPLARDPRRSHESLSQPYPGAHSTIRRET